MRLCIASRFAAAASMSTRCGLSNAAGLHLEVCHWLVHGYVYSRSGLGVANPLKLKPVPVAFCVASAAYSLLPRVVCVDAVPLTVGSTSQASGDALSAMTRSHPAGAVWHHVSRGSFEL